jgi:hypothetical protein
LCTHAADPCSVSAGSGRFGEHLVQYAAQLVREGHESTMVTGEIDHGGTELVGKRYGRTVGSCPLDVVPPATTTRVDAARSAWMSGR